MICNSEASHGDSVSLQGNRERAAFFPACSTLKNAGPKPRPGQPTSYKPKPRPKCKIRSWKQTHQPMQWQARRNDAPHRRRHHGMRASYHAHGRRPGRHRPRGAAKFAGFRRNRPWRPHRHVSQHHERTLAMNLLANLVPSFKAEVQAKNGFVLRVNLSPLLSRWL